MCVAVLAAQVMGMGSAVMLVVISPKLSLVTLSVVPAMALGATQYSKAGGRQQACRTVERGGVVTHLGCWW